MVIGKNRENARFNIPVSLVVPVYSGELVVINQLKLCEKILSTFTKKYEILVADDNSMDNTSNLLKKNFIDKKNFKLIFNRTNIGIARNIKKLYSLAKYEYICLYSADGDWNPYDIKKLVIHSYKNNSDIVIGKRNKRVYSPYRRVISFYYNFLPKLLFHVDTIDAGSIKVIRRELIYYIPTISKSVFFEAELIIKAKNKGYVISSIPIKFKRNRGKKRKGGKIKLVITSLIDLINLRLRI